MPEDLTLKIRLST